MKCFRVVSAMIVFNSIMLLKVQAQVDSLEYNRYSADLSLGAVYSNDKFLPFYLVNNRWGEVQDDQTVFLMGDVSYKHVLNDKWKFNGGFSFRNDIVSSHFVRIEYDKLSLSLGRLKEPIGGLANSLSSGSLALSRNARPLPMIKAGIQDYINVPFTGGYFKTKGHIAHGWFDRDRYISNSLLHSKSFYLKLDLEDEIGWSAASGVVHFAQYGGVSSQGEKQPSSFSDFLRVFAGSGIPNPDGTTAGESNGLGNHLGIVETTVSQRVGKHRLTLNYQKPFEDFGGLQYISLTDYLIGLEWNLPEPNSLINRIYFEYVQTKWQGGPGLPDATDIVQNEADNLGFSFGGRDDNYNNFLYRSGWTYMGQVIGNPLFLTYQRTLIFFEEYPDYGVAIANNRIRAVHFAMEGWFDSKFNYLAQFTYSQNFGTYAGLYAGRFAWNGIINDPDFDYVFRSSQVQYYTQLKFSYRELLNDLRIHLGLRLAYDFGDLYESFGAEVSVGYSFNRD